VVPHAEQKQEKNAIPGEGHSLIADPSPAFQQSCKEDLQGGMKTRSVVSTWTNTRSVVSTRSISNGSNPTNLTSSLMYKTWAHGRRHSFLPSPQGPHQPLGKFRHGLRHEMVVACLDHRKAVQRRYCLGIWLRSTQRPWHSLAMPLLFIRLHHGHSFTWI